MKTLLLSISTLFALHAIADPSGNGEASRPESLVIDRECEELLHDETGLSLENRVLRRVGRNQIIDAVLPNERNFQRIENRNQDNLQNHAYGWMTYVEHLQRHTGFTDQSLERSNAETKEILKEKKLTTEQLSRWRRYYFWLNKLPQDITEDLVTVVENPDSIVYFTRILDLLLQAKTAYGSVPEMLGYRRSSYKAQNILELVEVGEIVKNCESTQGDSCFSAIENWIKSSHHAIALYRLTLALDMNVRKAILERLISSNPYFAGAQLTSSEPYVLITRAFEKETTNPALALMYLPESEKFDDWVEKAPSDLKNLLKATRSTVPTEFYIPRLSDIRFDGHVNQDPYYEVKSADFEISPTSLFDILDSLLGLLNETREMHEHIVFPMPEYASEELKIQFSLWFKYVNDILFWVGLTDKNPIAPSFETKIATGDELVEWSRNDNQRFKGYSMGIRYGFFESKSRLIPGWILVSTELRDVTGEPLRWKALDKDISQAILDKAWENQFSSGIMNLNVSPKYHELVFADSEAITQEELELLAQFNMAVSFPLQKLEEMRWGGANPQSARPLQLQQLQDLQRARAEYLSELKTLIAEIQRLEDAKADSDKGKWSEEDKAAISQVINLALADFAGYAGIRNWLRYN